MEVGEAPELAGLAQVIGLDDELLVPLEMTLHEERHLVEESLLGDEVLALAEASSGPTPSARVDSAHRVRALFSSALAKVGLVTVRGGRLDPEVRASSRSEPFENE